MNITKLNIEKQKKKIKTSENLTFASLILNRKSFFDVAEAIISHFGVNLEVDIALFLCVSWKFFNAGLKIAYSTANIHHERHHGHKTEKGKQSLS